MDARRNHKVEFYADDEAFVVGFTRFIEGALATGAAVIMVVTESHRESLFQRLRERGVDIAAAMEEGRYVSLDIAGTLSTFMVDGWPDRDRHLKLAGDLIAAAGKASKGVDSRVALCGECAPVLWEQGKSDAAVELEHLWDVMVKSSDADVLCGYVLSTVQREQGRDIFERICAEHSAVSSL